jgi:hypothetical protein
MRDIRSGQNVIPEIHLCEMEQVGYKSGQTYFESRFEIDYLPIIQSLGNLRKVSQGYIDAVSGIRIGMVLYNLKIGKTSVPEKHMEAMKMLGFDHVTPCRKRTRHV